jgi:hypothetical protein
MLKTLLLFLALSPAFAASAKLPEVQFRVRSKLGNLTLDPGLYQVKVQGSIVFFTDAAGKTYSTIARPTKLAEKATASTVMGSEADDGSYQVTSICIPGFDFRLGF